MKNQRGFALFPVILALVILLGIGGITYVYVNPHRTEGPTGINQASDNFVESSTHAASEKEDIPLKNSSSDLVINYFRLSAASGSNTPIAEWSVSNASINSCIIFRYTAAYRGTSDRPDKTYSVNASGTLALENGYFYTLGCSGSHNGENATAEQYLNLLSKGSVEVSVSGMSKYTESNFGFSFWYPSTWNVQPQVTGGNLEDCTYERGYAINWYQHTSGVTVAEYYCPNLSMTLRGAGGTNPVGIDIKYFFDTTTHTWMYSDLSDPPYGAPRKTAAVDVSNNTMGGLHIFGGVARFGAQVVVPLSARNFLIITTGDVGGYIDQRLFAKTIVATDPSVATPISVEEQKNIIIAEQNAYAGR